jgi:amino-acid N-acetyltransferase
VKPAVRRARKADLPAVLDLLEGAGLPRAGVEDPFPGAYRVFCGETILGVCGLEAHGRSGLLRSLAVAEGSRGSGIGSALVDSALAAARRRGFASVWLLTTTAEAFFAKRGFEAVPREEAPPEIRATVEFASACPASAVLMRRPVDR